MGEILIYLLQVVPFTGFVALSGAGFSGARAFGEAPGPKRFSCSCSYAILPAFFPWFWSRPTSGVSFGSAWPMDFPAGKWVGRLPWTLILHLPFFCICGVN